MEGSESEAVFESYDLTPQLFINEILNRADELVDSAFDYFHQEASNLFKTDAADRSEDLKTGISYIHHSLQAALDKRLIMWERYCLHHCFVVPPGFSLPSERTSGDHPMDQDDLSDEQADAQLEVLRKKLAVAGKECSELNQELQEIERKSSMTSESASSVTKALELYETSSGYEMFEEMVRVANELRRKMKQLKSKQEEENARDLRGRANGMCELNFSKGLSSLKLDELQGFIAEMDL